MVCWNGAAGKCKGHHTFTRDEKPGDSQWQYDKRDSMYSASARELYIKLARVMLILCLMPIINRNLRLGGIYHTLVLLQIERRMSSLTKSNQGDQK